VRPASALTFAGRCGGSGVTASAEDCGVQSIAGAAKPPTIPLEDKEYVESFRELLPANSPLALDEGQSRKLIATLASEYHRRSVRDASNRLEEEQL
jgi:hypothetical protein